MRTASGGGTITWGTAAARWVLVATVAGSGLAFLDATTVTVALPAIDRDLDVGIAGLQWVLNAYTLALAALIPLGGALADRYGRRRIFQLGVVWFAAASLLCAMAPTGEVLALARGLQGVGGALLTPGSLAILQASFAPRDRARAIGAWSGLSGIAAAAGPLAGGWLVDVLSWRWIFFTNLPLAALVFFLTARYVPESRDPQAPPRFDVPGAVLVVVGLGGLSWALIGAGEHGFGLAQVALAAAGLAALAGFVAVQARSPYPMLPLSLFASRRSGDTGGADGADGANRSNFAAANAATLAVYAALAGMMFLLVIYLQQVAGYSALAAGAALLPITVLMLAFSARAGELAQRIGPRWPMTVGPLVMAGGMLLLLRLDGTAPYLTIVLPAMLIFGAGLTLTVAPLTATVLASVPDRHSGVASAVNNALSRGAGLLAVAVLPVAAGITGSSGPTGFVTGFRTAMLICAGLAAAGGLVSAALIRNQLAPGTPGCRTGHRQRHCAVDGPPLETTQVTGG